jgi:UDP-N-acetylmuramyl pentapeptide phosphotransferase/UDP-N-acetylglucosamine-1-phosphate transferase
MIQEAMLAISMLPVAIILITYVITLALTASIRRVLIKRALLDHPNERSSHKKPVPRGGGLAVVIVLVAGMLLAAHPHKILAMHAGLIFGAVILAIVSWLDDRKGLSPAARLAVHIFAACIGSFAFAPHAMIFAGLLPFWLDRAMMIIGWAWFVNLYNFMDGIDGITSVETVSIAAGACLIMTATGIIDPFADTLTLLLIGSSLGFLVFNWHPAKIFLGDVGSVPLGYLCGFVLLVLAVHGQFVPALIIPLYYLADSGITLAKRILRREKFWQPHRQHFYQRAAQRLGRHDKVVIRIIIANLALLIAALLAVFHPGIGLIVCVVAVAILLKTLHK